MKKEFLTFLMLIGINTFAQSWNPVGTTYAGTSCINGFGSCQLGWPYDIVFSSNGTMYISDCGWGGIFSVSSANSPCRDEIVNSCWTSEPYGLFIDNDTIYEAGGPSCVVRKWIPPAYSASNYQVVAGDGTNGSSNNQLYMPHGVWLDVARNIYIADAKNNRIMKWPPGAVTGSMAVNSTGMGAGLDAFYNPEYLVGDGLGNLYISDVFNKRVVKWQLEVVLGN